MKFGIYIKDIVDATFVEVEYAKGTLIHPIVVKIDNVSHPVYVRINIIQESDMVRIATTVAKNRSYMQNQALDQHVKSDEQKPKDYFLYNPVMEMVTSALLSHDIGDLNRAYQVYTANYPTSVLLCLEFITWAKDLHDDVLARIICENTQHQVVNYYYAQKYNTLHEYDAPLQQDYYLETTKVCMGLLEKVHIQTM